MTHRLILIFSLFIFLSSCAVSKKKAASELSYKPLENSLLWKIQGEGLNDSYLFGTIHIIDSESFFYPDGLLTAVENSDKMMFEVDMNEMNDLSVQMGLLQKATMKDDLSLSDLLSEEDYELVKAHFKKIGLPLFMLEKLKPMFLTVFAGDMDPQGLQNGSMKSYEFELVNLGNQNNKSIGGLETMDYQLSVFDSIPYDEQAQMLVEAIKQTDTDSDYLKDMIDVYVQQDLNKMMAMFEEEGSDLEGYEDVLLVNRNKNWIPVIKEEMGKQSTFFAVGAGHLGGETGVIHLLRKKGLTVSAINPKN